MGSPKAVKIIYARYRYTSGYMQKKGVNINKS